MYQIVHLEKVDNLWVIAGERDSWAVCKAIIIDCVIKREGRGEGLVDIFECHFYITVQLITR